VDTTDCENCGEIVDAAKAFCPACGDSLVTEEIRESESEFDASVRTVQFGSAVYNQLLSEMGLNISEPPNKPAQNPEPLAQAASLPEHHIVPPDATPRSRRKWIIAGVAFVFLIIFGAILLAAAIFLYLRWDQFRF